MWKQGNACTRASEASNRSSDNRTLGKEERGNCGCPDRDRSVDQVTNDVVIGDPKSHFENWKTCIGTTSFG